MIISNKSWDKYIAGLRAVNQTAADKMAAYLAQFETWTTPQTRKALIDYAYSLSTAYGEAAAELACQMYDSMVGLSGKGYPAAEPAGTADIHEVAKAVNGTIKTGNAEVVAGAVGRLVKMAGVDTTMYNALRDGAEWAWIPRGDTCMFCLTLASRGWQRASKSALKDGHAEHIHANCDCTYAIRFDDDTDVEGYDPEIYKRMYDEASQGDSQDKINAMRRGAYKENKEKINEQKRSAYAKRKERESSAAEEIVV